MTALLEAVGMWPLLALAAALAPLAVAAVVIVPAHRTKLRRMVLLVSSVALVGGTHVLLRLLGFEDGATWLAVATWLLLAFTAVFVVSSALFEGVLPRLGVHPAPIVYELVTAGSSAFAGVVVLTACGVDLAGVFAASTVAAAILTISLQTTLGNVLGGVAVQFDRSIRAGDWVQLDGGREGRVREIRWRHTVVETRDGDVIVVPNSALLSSVLTLFGRKDGKVHPHRVAVEFLTDVTVPPDLVVSVIQEALRASPLDNVAAEPEPDCVCVDLGAHGAGFARFRARVWIHDPLPDGPTLTQVYARIHAAMRRAQIPFGAPSAGIYGLGDHERELAVRRRADARQLLDQIPLLAPLTAAERDALAPRLGYRPYAAGEIVTRQGDRAHGLYLVGRGAVRVVAESAAGSRELAVLRGPAVFGEMGLLTGEARTASVLAVDAVECWFLAKPDFDTILRDRAEIATELSALLASRRTANEQDLPPADRRARERAEQRLILDRIRTFFGL